MGALRTNTRQPVRQAGELLPIEALDVSGLAVSSEGAFVRVLEVTPPNPLILSGQERARIARGYCQLVSGLRANERLQFYIHSRPVNLKEILTAARSEVALTAGPPPTSLDGDSEDLLGLSKWRLYAAMEQSLRLHCDEQAAVATSFYVVCPYVPARPRKSELLAELRRGQRLLRAPLTRSLRAHRRAARESLAFAETIRTELDTLAIPSHLLNGQEFLSLLWQRFNPSSADRSAGAPNATEIIGSLDSEIDAQQARVAARRLRSAIAQSAVDFERSSHHVEVDQEVEQTVWVATTAEHTQLAWLMGAMMTRQPFSLSVHVRALDRRRERNRLKMRYRRVYSVNRGAEARGRVPDFDRYQQESESAQLLQDMAGSDRVGLFDASIYLTLKAPGPSPDLAELAEAVDFCAEALTSTSDAKVNRGAHHQRKLWPSTLPLGRDPAAYSRVYATQNIGDCVPLAGTSCGSPHGVPFAFASPGRTLERIDPIDRAHDNQTLLIAGKSGSGKTLLVNTLISRCIALGAGPVFAIDHTVGHYKTLSSLVHGARHLEIGAESSQWALNPWDTPDQAAVPREKVAFLLALHSAMMGSEQLSVLERSQLAEAIRQVYATAHAQGIPASESMLRSELLARASQEREEGAIDAYATLRTLAERLSEFCDQGAYSYLLDRPTNIPKDSPLVVFDTASCPEAILGPVMLALVEYVTREIKEHHSKHQHLVGQPGVPRLMLMCTLLIDEAWHKVASPAAGVYLANLARRARHLGLLLIVISQAFSDLNSEHGMPLLVNHAITIFLKQVSRHELAFTEEAFGLTAEQTRIVGNLQTVDGRYAELFWMNGSRGMGRARFTVGPTEYWAYTNEPLNDIPAREAAIARHHGDVWAAICDLAAKGIPTGEH
jgi:hypothetical protein